MFTTGPHRFTHGLGCDTICRVMQCSLKPLNLCLTAKTLRNPRHVLGHDLALNKLSALITFSKISCSYLAST